MSSLGIVTLGQAPRSDVVPQMRRYLPSGVHIVEAGALDGASASEVRELRPRPGEYVLTTRMTNGSSVVVSKERLMPRLEAAFRRVVDAEVDSILLLCCGEFPELDEQILVAEPDRLLRHTVMAFNPQRLGVLIPLPEQVDEAMARWSEVSH